ncbi:hypothetical protein HNR19_003666 [Nocardioides thalensis]|uniref:Uncharacterized protein n=1 Tax=Nocardioides thalensis TaxID=1914755 RepID=A0A853C948_9ACTN|nr:hypothetical protein [Nocardioides thalensis]NYJ02968.1 hypothetical protein [Nocardioides thalensis]
MRTRRTVLGVLAGLLAVATVAGCSDSGEDPAAGPTTSASPSERPPEVDDDREGEQVSCPPDAAAATAEEQQVARVARCAVVAYTEFSWRDQDHRAFLDRVEPYATEAFAAELRELFGEDVPAEAAAWDELVAARTLQRTIVLDSDASRAEGEGWTVTVDVDTERRTEADDWEPYGEPRTLRVSVVPDRGGWLVADIS